MSTSGLENDQTKASLGFAVGQTSVSQLTAGSGISLSPSGGTGVVQVSSTLQPPLIVEYKQDISQYFDNLSTLPTYAPLGTFTTSYTPPADGKLQIMVSGFGSHGSSPVNLVLYCLALVINGTKYGSFDGSLMSGTTKAGSSVKANMSFSFPYDAVAGVPLTITLVACQLGSDGTEGLTCMSWMITFFPTTPIPVPVAVLSAPIVEVEAPPAIATYQTATIYTAVDEPIVVHWDEKSPNQSQVYWG